MEMRSHQEDGHVEITQIASTPTLPSLSSSEPPSERRKILRIFPYGINRHRLEQVIHDLDAPARLVAHQAQSDVVLTVKGQLKRQPKELRTLIEQGLSLYTLRSDTMMQMGKFLREQLAESFPEDQSALADAEAAIEQVIEQKQPVELAPQKPRLRRLQHEFVKRYGLTSKSRGEEPFRRLVIYPAR